MQVSEQFTAYLSAVATTLMPAAGPGNGAGAGATQATTVLSAPGAGAAPAGAGYGSALLPPAPDRPVTTTFPLLSTAMAAGESLMSPICLSLCSHRIVPSASEYLAV